MQYCWPSILLCCAQVAVRGPLNPDSEVVLPGMGMPKPEDPAQTGDLYVRFHICFPERVSSAQKAQLQAALS
jgi:DnaJ-class molecular chaperone